MLVKEGAYSITYQSPFGSGTGIAFIRRGTFCGGDAAFGFEGTYALAGDSISADIEMFPHVKAPPLSVAGVQDGRLKAKGRSTPNGFTLTSPLRGAFGEIVITATFVRD